MVNLNDLPPRIREFALFVLKNYRGKIVEVGIGGFDLLARFLAERGYEILAVDIDRSLSDKVGVELEIDDISNPRLELYSGSSLIYSIRPNPEMIPHLISLARKIGADLAVLPLESDHIVPEGGRIVNLSNGAYIYLWRFGR